MQFWFLHWSLTFAFCCTYRLDLFVYYIRSLVIWAGLMMRGLFSSSFCNPVIMWNQESKYYILFKTILEMLLKVAADEWNVKEKNCTKSIPCWIVRKGDFLKDLWKGAKIVENKIWGNTGDKAAGHKLVSPGKILLFGICRDIAAVKIKCRFKKRSSSC